MVWLLAEMVMLAVRWGLARRVEEYLLQIRAWCRQINKEVMWLRRILVKVRQRPGR